MTKKIQFFAIAAAILAVIFWGLSFVWVKVVYLDYKPITTTYIRLMLSTFILSIVYFTNKNRQKFQKKDLPILILLAFCEPFLYFIGESFGLQKVPSVLGSIIISTIPVFTPIFAFFILREKLSLMNYLGLMLSFFGVLLMILKKDLSFAFDPEGIALMFMAVFSAVFYTIVLGKIAHKYKPLNIVMIQNAFGIVFFTPFFFYFDFKDFLSVSPRFETIQALILLSVFASIGAFMFYIYAVNKLGVGKTSAFSNLIPVVTIIAAYFLINEAITAKVVIGIIVVLMGVFLTHLKVKSPAWLKSKNK